jgi:hypothetical protein
MAQPPPPVRTCCALAEWLQLEPFSDGATSPSRPDLLRSPEVYAALTPAAGATSPSRPDLLRSTLPQSIAAAPVGATSPSRPDLLR